MAENSKIQWTTHTLNPWRGCTKVSPGCAHCYAETLSGRNPKTLGVWGPSGTRVVAAESQWREPLKWNKAAGEAGERHRVFCASLADVFEAWGGRMVDAHGNHLVRVGPGSHTDPRSGAAWKSVAAVEEYDVRDLLTMDDVRSRLFCLIHQTPNLDWLLLTKRADGIMPTLERMADRGGDGGDLAKQWLYGAVMPNVWLGVSVENQPAADSRIPHLFRVPAAVRFLSCEPLLDAVDLRRVNIGHDCPRYDALDGVTEFTMQRGPRIDWVIAGGESGPDARVCRVEWIKSIVTQCKRAKVPCFVKQLGSNVTTTLPDGERWPGHTGPTSRVQFHGDGYGNYRVSGLRDGKGGDEGEWPEGLRVREFPG
jgi:protein gp37